ncbi:MAG: SH3 domain-containing protein [Limnothrix sp.]
MNNNKITATLFATSLLLAQTAVSSNVSAQTAPQLLAQANSCREVNVKTYLNVRSAPNGEVIARLKDSELVYMTNKTSDGWVSINAPVSGYVSSRYLVYCAGYNPAAAPAAVVPDVSAVPLMTAGENVSTVAGDNCRAVNTDSLPVYTKPNGDIVGTLSEGQQVFIANEGFNGWVPIEAPVSGFISAAFLAQCAPGSTVGTSLSNQEAIATVDGTNCRQTVSADVPLRTEPNGTVIGLLTEGQQVYLANEGVNGWVPIEYPASGYVSSANLGMCSY